MTRNSSPSPRLKPLCYVAFAGRLCLTLGLALFGLTASAVQAFAQNDLARSAYEPTGSSADFGSRWYGTFPGFQQRPLDLVPERPSDRDPFRVPTRDPVPGLRVPARHDAPKSEVETIEERLTWRYRNPVVQRFIASLSGQAGPALYREVTQLIDTRHLKPSSYEDRVRQGLKNLTVAVDNSAFLEANRINVSADRIRSFQDAVGQVATTRTVRSAAEAQSVMTWAANLAQQQLGLRSNIIAAEFVYGAVESLDKYSAFEPEDRKRQPSAALEDHVVGIGVELKAHDEGVLVVKTLAGGPAATAGVKKDDVIVSVDGRSLRGQSLEYAADLIKGAAGSRITLGVLRDGRQYPNVTMARSRVELKSVSEARILGDDGRVGYIKLEQFAESTEREFDQALMSLHQQGMRSLIVDLRGNPGGLLTTAINLSDRFLASGNIVSTRGRTAQDQMSAKAKYEQTWKTPLVVMVDGDSASASEIFAAAIQENDRGLVLGHKSYGKGTVQTHFPLSSVAGTLRLTTAKFYSPQGREMADAGVTPDVPMDLIGSRLGVSLDADRELEFAVRVAASNRLVELAQAGARR